MAEHRRPRPHPRRPARQDRPARLLDVLLHQLPARPRRAAPARGEVRRRAGDRRRALAEVRARGRPGRAGRGRRALRACTTRCSTTPSCTTWQQYAVRAWPTLVVVDPEGYVVAQLAGEGHAHALDVAASPSWSPSTRRRARCTAATGRTSRRRRRRPSCASPARRSRCPAAPCWSPTPGTTALVELAADGETRAAAHRVAASAAWSTAARRGAVQRAAGPAACCPTSVRRRGRATTSWSPTPSTTRCAASGSPTATVTHGRRHRPAVDARDSEPRPTATCSSPWDVAWSRRPGRGRDGRHPPAVDVRPGHAGGRACCAGTTNEGLLDGPLPRRGSRSRPGSRRPTATGSGWPTPRPRRCAASTTARCTTAVGQRPVRLRPRRRPGGAGAAAAPARRRRRCPTARSRSRHLQRRGPPLRPRDRRGHARWPPGSPSRATSVVVDGDLRRRRVRRAPAHPAARCPTRRWSSTAWRTARSGRSPSVAPGRGRARGGVHAAGRAEARRPLRPVHPAAWSRRPRPGCCATARAAATDLTRQPGPRPARRRRRAARRRDGGVLRRRPGDRVPRLPRAPAGLGRAGPARRGRRPQLTLMLRALT